MSTHTSSNRAENSTIHSSSGELQPRQDLLEYAKEYVRQKPEVAALWCFGVGFIVGWKLKPW